MGFFGPPDTNALKVKRDVKGLIRALDYRRDIGVPRAAAEALGEIGDARAVEPLIAALQDDDYYLRRNAVRALGKIGDARAVGPLIAALQEHSPSERADAAAALGAIGAPAVEPLLAAVADPRYELRWFAAQALGETRDPRAVQPLVAALGDKEAIVGDTAAAALAEIGAPGVDALLATLAGGNSDLQWRAVKALGKSGDARAVEQLLAALQRDPRHLGPVAAEALQSLGWTPGNDETGALYWIARREWGKCAAIGAPAVGALVAAFSSCDPATCLQAAATLERIGDLPADIAVTVAEVRTREEAALLARLQSQFPRAPQSWFRQSPEDLLWLTTLEPNLYGASCYYHESGVCLARYLGQRDGSSGPERCSLQAGSHRNCFVWQIVPR